MVSSVDELFARSPLLDPDASISIQKYRDIVQSKVAEAAERQLDRDWERAALLYMRVAQLIARTLTNHPGFTLENNAVDVRELRRIAGCCFEALEEIQATVVAPGSGDSSPVTPTTPTAPTPASRKPDGTFQTNNSSGSGSHALPDLPRREKDSQAQTNSALRAAAVAAGSQDPQPTSVKQRAVSDLERRASVPRRGSGSQDYSGPRPNSAPDAVGGSSGPHSASANTSRGRSFNVREMSNPSSTSVIDEHARLSGEDRSKMATNRMTRTLSQRKEPTSQKFEGTSMSLSTKRIGERSKSATSRRDRGYLGQDFGEHTVPSPHARAIDQNTARALLKKNSVSVCERDRTAPKKRTSGFLGVMGRVRARGQKIFGAKQVVMPEPARAPLSPGAPSIISNPFVNEPVPPRLHSFSNKSRTHSSRELVVPNGAIPQTTPLTTLLHSPPSLLPVELRPVEIQNDVLRVFEKMSRESSTRGLRTLALLAAKREQLDKRGDIVISAIVFPQQTPVSDDRVEITDPKEVTSLEHVKGLSLVAIMISNLEQHAKLNIEDIRACAALQSKVPEAFTVLVPPNDPARRGLYSLTPAGLDLVRANPKATDSDMLGIDYYEETKHVRISHDHELNSNLKIYDLRGSAKHAAKKDR